MVTRVAEEPHHLHVLRQHEGPETPDVVLAGVGGHQLEQLRPDPPTLVLIFDCKGHLGGFRLVLDPVVPTHADDLVFVTGDEGHAILVVDVGEVLQLFGSEILLDAEEAEVPGLRAQTVEETVEPLGVVGLDGSKAGHGTIAQRQVDLVFGRVVAHVTP